MPPSCNAPNQTCGVCDQRQTIQHVHLFMNKTLYLMYLVVGPNCLRESTPCCQMNAPKTRLMLNFLILNDQEHRLI